MATKNIVPRATGEGGIGTSAKRWENGYFVDINASNDITAAGDVTVTGDVSAANVTVTGTITGDVTGDLTGNVTGDLTGNVTGDLTGNVTGNVTGTASGNLPLSGGTMTGTIIANPGTAIKKENDAGYLQFNGGSSDANGANLVLFGKDVTNNVGGFELRARISNGYSSSTLLGKTDGTLTWGGQNVLTASNYNSYALPLSGGTMTGTIHKNGNSILALNDVDNGFVEICGGSGSGHGSQLILRGKNTYSGGFILQSHDETNGVNLQGQPDGALTWGGDPIPVIGDNAGGHNSIYRGKNLGNTVTDAQYDEINAGTFRYLYIGDYWVINGVNWRIAAFDYWLHCGDTECTTHHVVIVPDTNLATCQMNNSNVTTGAYIGSNYYTGANSNTGKATANTAINNAFGSSHILTHREYLKNAVANGYESAGAWYDSKFELMTEQMVYGCKVFGNVVNGTNVPASYTIDKSQLPLFALEPSRITNRAHWWLRGVVSATSFALVDIDGACAGAGASNSGGVRPAFAIIK